MQRSEGLRIKEPNLKSKLRRRQPSSNNENNQHGARHSSLFLSDVTLKRNLFSDSRRYVEGHVVNARPLAGHCGALKYAIPTVIFTGYETHTVSRYRIYFAVLSAGDICHGSVAHKSSRGTTTKGA